MLLETACVLAVNVALACPESTVTVVGTVTTPVFALERETTEPPEGADAESVTVPIEV